MSRRATGAIFCAIAAFLFGVRYLVAAQLFGGMHPGMIDTNTLDLYLSYAGTPLVTTSILALIAGIVFLVWAEIDELRRRGQ